MAKIKRMKIENAKISPSTVYRAKYTHRFELGQVMKWSITHTSAGNSRMRIYTEIQNTSLFVNKRFENIIQFPHFPVKLSGLENYWILAHHWFTTAFWHKSQIVINEVLHNCTWEREREREREWEEEKKRGGETRREGKGEREGEKREKAGERKSGSLNKA